MSEKRRICVITGSRAEYGLLYWILHDLAADPQFELQLIATGMHLVPEFGHTVDEIIRDGFTVDRRVEMLLASDTRGGIARSVGLGVIGMSDALEQLKPDLVMVLGDRFEILAAAQAAMLLNIPIAHIAGGDVSEGAFDESIRHAITKMAHIHFVTHETSARRVRQMGENPAQIHVVGNPGLDHLRRRPQLDRTALEAALGAKLGAKNLLVTFHPVTLEEDAGVAQVDELLAALDQQPADVRIWITCPNADTGGHGIAATFRAWAAARPDRVAIYSSLGQTRYLGLMREVDVVVGNSSSGLYEAPSFKIPTVNIGDRQGGRLAAPSVLHCAPERGAIVQAITNAMGMDCSGVINTYGDGHGAEKILAVLHAMPAPASLLRKPFYLIGEDHV